MNTYLITNGRIIDPANKVDKIADILIENGKIAQIGKSLTKKNINKIDAKGKIVTPGLIDIHVHLREPGREDKETIETGMRAALKGGVTSLLAMPNTTPPADNQTVIEYQLSKANKLGLANLFVTGSITRNEDRIAEMNELKKTGAVALTDDGRDVQNEGLFRHALEWAKTFDMPVFCHAEVETLTDEGAMHEGSVSLELGLPGIPRSAEDMAIQKNIMLAQDTGAKIHISHISTCRGVQAVRQAKKDKIKVTAEATPHHFALTHEECRGWNTNAKMYPPLREEEDRLAVLEGLADGTIDVIATDHAPHLQNEKYLPFVDAPNGTVGLETLFGAVLTYLVRPKILSLPEAIAKMTVNPAKLLGIKKGTLSIGADADIAIFSVEQKWMVDPNRFESKGRNSAFAGKILYGKAETVLVKGELKVKNGNIL